MTFVQAQLRFKNFSLGERNTKMDGKLKIMQMYHKILTMYSKACTIFMREVRTNIELYVDF